MARSPTSTGSVGGGGALDTITLSVGGTWFESTLETLERAPFFAVLLRDPGGDTFRAPADGVYRIDKSPNPFTLILEYLREGLADMAWSDADWADEGLLQAVGRDASFYGCDELAIFVAQLFVLKHAQRGRTDSCFDGAGGYNGNFVVQWVLDTAGAPATFSLPPPSKPGGLSFAPKYRRDLQREFDCAHIYFNQQCLLDAARYPYHDSIILQLISAGAPVNTCGDSDRTILHRFVEDYRVQIVEALLQNGADVHAVSKDTRPVSVLQAALEKLVHEPRRERFLIVNALLKKGAKPPSQYAGEPLLHSIIGRLWHYDLIGEVVTELVKCGADINDRDKHGFTALHNACRTAGRTREVPILLAAGAAVDAPAPDGKTALHFAIFLGSADAVTMLLDARASTSVRDIAGKVPGFYLRGGGGAAPQPALVALLTARGVPLA